MTITPELFLTALHERCGYDGGVIVAGVSGGADSMCLLDLLLRSVGPEMILVLHVNHSIRGAEADRDMEHVRRFCEGAGVKCVSVTRDIPREAEGLGISLEEAGRRARYQELEALRERSGAGFIACAHHAGDRAETVMMNILRGTGIDGLKGISYRSGNVIRPLLGWTRAEILDYVGERGISFVTDETNADTRYRRNSVRNELFAYIRDSYGIDPVEKLNSLGDLAAEDADCLRGFAAELYGRAAVEIVSGERVTLDAKTVAGAHHALAVRVIRMAIADVKGDIVDISRDNIDAVLRVIGSTGKKVPLPHGCEAAVSYGRLTVRRANGQEMPEAGPGTLVMREEPYDPARAGEYMALNKRRPPGVMCFDGDAVDAIGQGVVLRHRRPGDRIRLERGGTKKLGDWMTDAKVPLELRDRLWIVAAGDFALAAPDYRVFGGFAPGKNSQKVYFLQID